MKYVLSNHKTTMQVYKPCIILQTVKKIIFRILHFSKVQDMCTNVRSICFKDIIIFKARN